MTSKSDLLQTVFLLTDKPIVSFNPKKLEDHPLSMELFGDLHKDEYNVLKNDIIERGIQDALHIVKRDDEYIVISGHQRKKVAIEIGIDVPCIIRGDLKEDWQIEEQLIKDNLLRRQLTDFLRGEIGKHLEPIEEKKAKQRQKESGEKYGKGVVNLSQPIEEKGKARDKVANQLGISGAQYDRIKTVRDEAPKKTKTEWKQGKISTHRAYLETTNKDKGMSEHSRNVIFSSNHDNWTTPIDKYKMLDKEFHFDFDPCPISPTFDGLKKDWEKTVFINPPYSNVSEFLKKGHDELNKKNSDVLVYLIPVRTDTQWFHNYIYPYYKKEKDGIKVDIRFIKGRLKFGGGNGEKHSAPFPSMEVVFRRVT